MTHAHTHHHGHADARDGRLVAAIAVNVLLTVAQIIGGVVSGSLSLVADALHNLSDAASLVIALVARRMGRRPADLSGTFGYRRVELVGALINATSLVLIGVYLLQEAAVRSFRPEEIGGWTVVAVAGIALAVDAVTALLTYARAHGDLNLRAAFVHNLTDALGSLAVIVAGVLILTLEWYFVDTVVTAAIAVYAIVQGVAVGRRAAAILALGTPPDVDLEALVAELREVPRVADVHHVHLWDIDERTRSFEAHVAVECESVREAASVRRDLRRVLAGRGIAHSTLELEFADAEAAGEPGEVVPPH